MTRWRASGLVFLAMMALVACESHMDVACKAKYSRNKLVLLALGIEQYQSEQGALPSRIKEIAPYTKALLHQHPELNNDYLDARWASREIDTCQLAPGYLIAYVLSSDRQHYYLAAPRSENLLRQLTYEYLESSASEGFQERDISYAIKDGCPKFSRFHPFPANICISESNYHEFLVPYRFTGHIWVD